MAIDADLNAGLIDEAQARARREQIAREAEFYGAMDGAARFSQRDALATILITAINIIAGFLIGVFQLNIPFEQALKTYTILTVGDGLVTMIPSLLVSVAGGMVVTRTSTNETVGVELGRQLFGKSVPLQIAAGVIFLLGLIPGLPKFSFFLLAAGAAFLASRASRERQEPARGSRCGEKRQESRSAAAARRICSSSTNSAWRWATRWCRLVDQGQGGQLLQRIRALRRIWHCSWVSSCLRSTSPTICKLKPREYVVYLRGVEIARWEMYQDRVLAISSEPSPAAARRLRNARAGLRHGRASGLPRACRSWRSTRDTWWWTRPPCWPRTSPKWCASSPTNCSRGRKPSACSTPWPKASPSWWTNWCRAC